MFTLIIIILVVLFIAILPFIIMSWIMRDVDFDQDDRQLFCESYKAMTTDNVEQSINNPGII